MDPTRSKLASPAASPTADRSSVRHVLKAFNAIEVGKPSKRNIAFDVTPTKNSEIENIGKSTEDPYGAAGSIDHQTLGLQRTLPDIVTTAHEQDKSNNDSLSGLLDNWQKLALATPIRKDDTNHLNIVERTLDSHASSDDEAFLECNSFIDESMLLHGTLHNGSRDDDLHTFLNETELLNPPTSSATPDFMDSHNMMTALGGWSLPSTMSNISNSADLANEDTTMLSIDKSPLSEDGNGNAVDPGGSSDSDQVKDDCLESTLNAQFDEPESESASTDEFRNLNITEVEFPEPIKSPFNAYDSEGSPNAPIVRESQQNNIESDKANEIPSHSPVIDVINTTPKLTHSEHEEFSQLPKSPSLPESGQCIDETTVANPILDGTLTFDDHTEQINNLNQTVDMAEEELQVNQPWDAQLNNQIHTKIASISTQMDCTQDEAMDVDYDDEIETYSLNNPSAGVLLNETAVVLHDAIFNDGTISSSETAVFRPNETCVSDGNVTFDEPCAADGFMGNATINVENEQIQSEISFSGDKTIPIGNTTENIDYPGDEHEIPSQDLSFGHSEDTNAVESNTTVVIDIPFISKRSNQNTTYISFEEGTSQSNQINDTLDDIVELTKSKKRNSFLARSSTMNPSALAQPSEQTFDIGDSSLNSTSSTSNEIIGSTDTSDATNVTVCHKTYTKAAADDEMFKTPNVPATTTTHSHTVNPNNDDLFKMPNIPKSSHETMGRTFSGASSNPSLNEQFGSGRGAIGGPPVGTTSDMWGMNDDDFQGNAMVFQSSDFDFLLSKGSTANTVPINSRDSLLLRFDPLLGRNILVAQPTTTTTVPTVVSITNPVSGVAIIKEEPLDESFTSAASTSMQDNNSPDDQQQQQYCLNSTLPLSENTNEAAGQESVFNHQPSSGLATSSKVSTTANATMSVGLIQDIKTDCDVKPFANRMEHNGHNSGLATMDLERKIKAELVKSEDAEKKLKEAEQREESLLRRITEKDKSIQKMNGLMEQYEKAIAELVSEKEAAISSYEAKNAELKADRDSNFQHLSSLENTFSDLHAKYERSKQLTAQLKDSEQALRGEVDRAQELLKQQELRYEKMKNHAIQQLDIANNKLEVLTRNNTMESTKLKAHLKKEEISRQAAIEQLNQKNKENEELMKICDELINGQSS